MSSNKRRRPSRSVLTYTLGGIVCGFSFPLGAWILDSATRNLDWSLAGIWRAHLTNYLHWIIDSAPLVLGVFAYQIGRRKQAQEAVLEANKKLTESLSELERRSGKVALLNELSELLQSCHTTEEAYSVVARLARQLFPGEAGGLSVIAASRNLVETAVVWGDTPPDRSVFAPEDCWALRRGRIHVVVDRRFGQTCQHVNHSMPYVCVPMMAQGEAQAVLHLEQNDPGKSQSLEGADEFWTEPKQRLVQSMADSIALALANLNLRETLRHQSIRDPLTGLFNRRYMEEMFEREMHRAVRNKHPLGVIMIDLDRFKRFNDTFGHAGGDALLRDVGNFIKTHVRAEDIACRYGGEEFTLLLPEASLEVTRQRAEQLRDGAKHLQAQHGGKLLGSITLTLGVAVFPDHGATADVVLRAADTALYRAKHEGRDRVVVAQ